MDPNLSSKNAYADVMQGVSSAYHDTREDDTDSSNYNDAGKQNANRLKKHVKTAGSRNMLKGDSSRDLPSRDMVSTNRFPQSMSATSKLENSKIIVTKPFADLDLSDS